MMIENFEQRFKKLNSDKAKHENLLFINPFAVDPGKMDFWKAVPVTTFPELRSLRISSFASE